MTYGAVHVDAPGLVWFGLVWLTSNCMHVCGALGFCVAQEQPQGDAMISQEMLDSFNQPQQTEGNASALNAIGGVDALLARLEVTPEAGLTDEQYERNAQVFGVNEFPEKPMTSFITLFFKAFNDFTLVVLVIAA